MFVEQNSDPNHPLHPANTPEALERLQVCDRDFYKVSRTLEQILHRPWFTRVWVIQEVALAKEIHLRCANIAFSWIDFEKAVRQCAETQALTRETLFHAPLQIMDIRNCYQGSHLSLEDALTLSRTFEATNPRDKVYGLLGIFPDLSSLIGGPDYRHGVEEVWTRAGRALLQRISLRALTLVSAAIPSWLPDMDAMDLSTSKIPMDVACKNTATTITIKNGLLHAEAAVSDTVTAVADGNTSGNNKQMWRAWFDWIQQAGPLDPEQRDFQAPELKGIISWDQRSQERKETVFWRLLFCDMDNKITWGEMLWDWHSWFCLETAMSLLVMESRSLSDRDSDESLIAPDFPISVALLRYRMRHRAAFSTEKGLWGMGIRGTRVGDVLAVFRGYDVPFVLRQIPATFVDRIRAKLGGVATPKYQIVGPCYIDGLMNGEKYEDIKKEWHQITLV